jgi:hypothetical protein
LSVRAVDIGVDVRHPWVHADCGLKWERSVPCNTVTVLTRTYPFREIVSRDRCATFRDNAGHRYPGWWVQSHCLFDHSLKVRHRLRLFEWQGCRLFLFRDLGTYLFP